MIAYVTLGVSDIAAARTFYLQLLDPIDFSCVVDLPGRLAFGLRYPELWLIARPAMDPIKAEANEGCAVAFVARDPNAVDAFFEIAMRLQAKPVEAPGLKAQTISNAYKAAVLDLDGNRIEIVYLDGAELTRR
jgi:predicted lactoylglutathione lyase